MNDLRAWRVLTLAGFLLCAGAGAHQPLFNPGSGTLETAFRVPQPTVSKVITVQGRAGGRDWYALSTGAGFRLDVAVFVSSACDAAYRPRLWLVGPGVPVTAGGPDFVPDGWGAVGVSGPYAAYSGHGVVGWRGPTLARTLGAGTHYLVLEHGTRGGWSFISLAGAEVPGGTTEGRAALGRFGRCGG